MKRQIIRSFFIGLLLLSWGVFAASDQFGWTVNYTGHDYWDVTCVDIYIHLTWRNDSFVSWHRKGWTVHAAKRLAFETESDVALINRRELFTRFDHDFVTIIIPLWMPIVVSAVLLCLVWWKTRPKAKGRAFPVELERPKVEP